MSDPYNDQKRYHLAALINKRGRVSALCYKSPRAIPNTERWALDERAVTCEKCKQARERTRRAVEDARAGS